MADISKIATLADLRISVEEREQVAQLTGELIAVQVYRELQLANQRAAGDNGCQIIGNCSSSSKNSMLGVSTLK